MRGRRRGKDVVGRVVGELRQARLAAGLSREQLARALESSPAAIARIETGELKDVGLIRLSELASVLGYEISLGLHPIGDPVRDRAQLAIGRRFEGLLSPKWRVTDETLLPGTSELRAWDKLLRLTGTPERHLVGVDIESRVWDVQSLVRRTRGPERDGHVDAILIVLADSATNRRLVGELRESLGPDYAISPRRVLGALRAGALLPGSGVLLVWR